MFVSISVPVGTADDIARLARRAKAAEQAGIDAVFVTDHPAPPASWLERGGHPTLDPFVALAHLGAHTTTLRLHTNLLVLGYRNPLLAAKAIASLDAVTAGRVLLGVGVGYLAGEFEALGADHTGRGELTTMRRAWTGTPTGPNDTVILPLPVQRPHPPIWIGGNSRAAMRRAVEFGRGWSPMPSPKSAARLLDTPGIESAAELGDRIKLLHEMAAVAGRTDALDVAVIPTSASGFTRGGRVDSSALIEEIEELRAVGGTALVINLPDDAWDAALEQLARTVLPRI
jgi:probable F420-dependent oxidoreductase